MSSFPDIFTFYSFKGGVGRSMALLNTAYALAGWGRHVLIVDMDLEAPGVSGFLHRHKELAAPRTEHTLDILTLLGEVVSATRAGKKAREIAENLPPLPNYLRSVAAEKLKSLRPKFGSIGRLDVIAADMEREWCRRLADLRLSGMPQDRLIEISSALHFYFKAHRFAHRPHGLEDFEPAQPTPYDYILVDSRTGITDVGGLCVGPLADRLIVLSALNDQNIQGTLTFLKEAGIEPKRRPKKSPRWDDADVPAEAEAPTLGPKPTILVASPVPNGEIEFKKKRLAALQKKIGIPPARLSYHPQMALMESVFVRDYRDEYLAREYFELAERLTRQVGDHPAQIAARDQKRTPGVDVETVQSALRIAPMQADVGYMVLSRFGNAFEPKTDADFLVARRVWATLAVDSDIKDQAFSNWGNALSAQAKTKQGVEADRLFGEAYGKYADAVRIKPDNHEALNNWGNALTAQAKTKRGVEADRLFGEAYGKYADALKIKPDDHEKLNNWGIALSEQAKTKQGADADRLFSETRKKFMKARAIKVGPASYCLACLEALLRNAKESIHWLQDAMAAGEALTAKRIADETDFDSIRNDPQFSAFIKTLKAE